MDSQSTPVVSLQEVTFAYPSQDASQPVLDDISLEVDGLDFLGVIGPNGGGKTTLLKIILGLLRPQKGTVQLFGKNARQAERRIGYVPQSSHVDPMVPANVLDVVLTGLLDQSRWGVFYSKKKRDLARAALEQTGTADLANCRIGELSGGQRQRVLIARALAGDAQLLLLDEPMTGVDFQAERELIDLLHSLNERLPIIIVSHDIAFVSRHLKRIGCLNRRLAIHPAGEISNDILAETYGPDARLVRHGADCALARPECDREDCFHLHENHQS